MNSGIIHQRTFIGRMNMNENLHIHRRPIIGNSMRVQLFPNESRGRASKLIFGHVSFITLISSVAGGASMAVDGGGLWRPTRKRRVAEFNWFRGEFFNRCTRVGYRSTAHHLGYRLMSKFNWIYFNFSRRGGKMGLDFEERSRTIGRL